MIAASYLEIRCDATGCTNAILVRLGVAQAGIGPPLAYNERWLVEQIVAAGWSACRRHGHGCAQHGVACRPKPIITAQEAQH